MAEFPLEPKLSKILLASVDLDCAYEITVIIAMLNVQGIFYRPNDNKFEADKKKNKFNDPYGDHLTLLNVYKEYKNQTDNFSTKEKENWCNKNFLHFRSLKKAEEIHRQLVLILERYHLYNVKEGSFVLSSAQKTKIIKAITSGYFTNIAKKNSGDGYRNLYDDRIVYIHPSSALYNKNPEWVLYNELIQTSKDYMRDISVINKKWLVEIAGTFYKVSDGVNKRQKNEKIEPIHHKYEDPNAWRLSKRKYN